MVPVVGLETRVATSALPHRSCRGAVPVNHACVAVSAGLPARYGSTSATRYRDRVRSGLREKSGARPNAVHSKRSTGSHESTYVCRCRAGPEPLGCRYPKEHTTRSAADHDPKAGRPGVGPPHVPVGRCLVGGVGWDPARTS